jgi:multicomponent Na+:H+ antiporter subunit D
MLIPFATAVAAFALRARPAAARTAAFVGAAALLVAAALLFLRVRAGGPIATTMGAWPAPFGIAFAADLLSAVMVLVTAAVGLAVTVYGFADVDADEARAGHDPLAQVLLAGVCAAFLTADLFNLYVWFEIIVISCFGLLSVRRGAVPLDGTAKYMALNLIATTALLAGVGLLYGTTGALNMGDLHLRLQGRWGEAAVLAPAALLLFAFSAKAGLFPLFAWLPAAYHTPSVTVSALFSALVTKVAVYALYRVFTLILPLSELPFGQSLMLWVACLTMAVGVLGAAAQNEVRRILSFHIVSQIGYMVLGLALFTPLGLAGGLFYMVHNIVAKTNLFLMGGAAARLAGSEALARMGGLWAARPGLSVLFLVSALAMAGVPPLSGFWAKYFLVRESLLTGYALEATVALAVGLLTLYSMTKIWAEAFWKPAPEPLSAAPLPVAMVWPGLALVVVMVAMGLWIAPLHALAMDVAAQLLDPSAYVAAVMEARP